MIVSPSLWSSHTPEIGERARSIPHDSVLDAVLCTDSRRPSDSAPDCTLSGPCSTNPDRSGDDPYEAPCEAELRNKTAAEVRAELFGSAVLVTSPTSAFVDFVDCFLSVLFFPCTLLMLWWSSLPRVFVYTRPLLIQSAGRLRHRRVRPEMHLSRGQPEKKG